MVLLVYRNDKKGNKMSKLFILQNFLAKQLSGKLNYLDNEYWQNKAITGNDILEKTKEFTLTVEDFNSLSISDAKSLGFSKWSDEFEELYLIPSYLWRFIPVGLDIRDFDNNSVLYDDFSQLDNDERFGCLAYGLNIK